MRSELLSSSFSRWYHPQAYWLFEYSLYCRHFEQVAHSCALPVVTGLSPREAEGHGHVVSRVRMGYRFSA
jgi:hypothetical protein